MPAPASQPLDPAADPRFAVVHHRALNSPEGLAGAAKAAAGLPSFQLAAEGDLCWCATDSGLVLYLRHPDRVYDALGPQDSMARQGRQDVPAVAVDAGRLRRLGSFSAPGTGVEDLATDGHRLWTSDERSFHWYVLPDLPRMVERLAER